MELEVGAWRNNGVLPSGNNVTGVSLYYCMFCISFSVILFFCLLYMYERDFCDINHAQWRWGRGADLSTTRRPHINIRRIRGNLLLLNYPDENQSNKDWFIVGCEKSKLMNRNKHFGHLSPSRISSNIYSTCMWIPIILPFVKHQPRLKWRPSTKTPHEEYVQMRKS